MRLKISTPNFKRENHATRCGRSTPTYPKLTGCFVGAIAEAGGKDDGGAMYIC